MPKRTKKADVDVFGFDEIAEAFERVKKRYPNDADALLMAAAKAVRARTSAKAPRYEGPAKRGIKPGQLKSSWRVRPPKEYKDGKVRVVQIRSTAPHAHLIELGHELYRGGKTRYGSERLNAMQLSTRGVKHLGRVEGVHMLEESMKEAREKFPKDAQKLLDRIITQWEK